jgi:hypothetical protein
MMAEATSEISPSQLESPPPPQPDRLQKVPPVGIANRLGHGGPDNDEKKEPEVTDGNAEMNTSRTAITALHSTQCDLVLESIDECVGCLDGIGEQHTFEDRLRVQAARQRQIATEHGLSEAEATLIRLQMIGDEGLRSAVESTLTNMNPLVLCGQQDDSISDLCDGVVSPMDTTLPTSLPGNALVESRQGKSARSLVDVAAESEQVHDSTVNLDSSIQECVICNDVCNHDIDESCHSMSSTKSARQPTFCHLPCCESEEGSVDNFKVCMACMLVLTVATNDGSSRVGRCPRCRTWLSVNTLHSTSARMDIQKIENSGKCETCLHIKNTLIAEDPPVCDACFLGREAPLIYECEECHQAQTIHSTMYRSQLTATTVGNEMWPCNTCQKSTHWKIRFEQLTLIPAGDIPEEWGDHSLELARSKVQKARRGIAKLDLLDLLGRDAQGKPSSDDGCCIM